VDHLDHRGPVSFRWDRLIRRCMDQMNQFLGLFGWGGLTRFVDIRPHERGKIRRNIVITFDLLVPAPIPIELGRRASREVSRLMPDGAKGPLALV